MTKCAEHDTEMQDTRYDSPNTSEILIFTEIIKHFVAWLKSIIKELYLETIKIYIITADCVSI